MKPKIGDAVKGTEEKIWIYQMGQIIHCPEGYEFRDENGNVVPKGSAKHRELHPEDF